MSEDPRELEREYQARAGIIDGLVERGNLDAVSAVQEKQAMRDDIERRKLAAVEQAPTPAAPVVDVQRQWDKAWKAAAQEFDLNAGDPEYKEFQALKVEGQDFDEYVASLRGGTRKLSDKKEKRLSQAAKPTPPTPAPAARTREQVEGELRKALDQVETDDPKKVFAHQKRLRALNQELDGMG